MGRHFKESENERETASRAARTRSRAAATRSGTSGAPQSKLGRTVRPQQKKKSKKSKGPMIAIAVAAALVAIFAAVMLYYVYGYDKVYPGVHGLDVDLSGMTEAEARSAIQKVSDDYYKDKSVVIYCEGAEENYTKITASEAGISTDASVGAEKAIEYGREGGIFERMGEIMAGWGGGIDLDIPTVYDVSVVPSKVDEFAAKVESEVTTPEYEIKDDYLVINLGESGARLDKRAIIKDVSEMLSSSKFGEYKAELVTLTPDNLDIDSIYNEVHTDAKDATLAINGKDYTIEPEQVGKDFDLAAAKKELKSGEEREYKFKIETVQPEITESQLKEVLFRDVIGTATTHLNSSDVNRTTNVRLATEAVDGTIIDAGNNFSYNEVVGERTEERGFKNAKIFASGEVVDGIGGGICQLSSTIYIATLKSNLEIVSRSSHRFAVSYTELGQDATVAWPTLDYVFKNSSQYPIRVKATLDGGDLTVKIYGTKTDDYTYELISTTLDTVEPELKETFVNTLGPGVQNVVSKGANGYISETYRIVRDADGNEIDRQFINKSNYKPQNKVVETGALFDANGQPILDANGRPVLNQVTTPPATTTTTTTTTTTSTSTSTSSATTSSDSSTQQTPVDPAPDDGAVVDPTQDGSGDSGSGDTGGEDSGDDPIVLE